MEIRILVAIGNTGLDESTADYLINLFKGRVEVMFDLFTIVQIEGVTESQRLLGDIASMAISHPVALKKKAAAANHLSALETKFHNGGFSEEQVACQAVFSYSGVADTLLQKGQSGLYDAIVLAKRDISALQKMLLGSISATLWQKDHSVPLWVISGKPANRHFLVPVDSSLHTLDAVDHLAFILQGDKDAEISLFHSISMLGDQDIVPKEKFYEKWGQEWCEQHLKGDGDGYYHFHAAEQILKENKIPADHVHRINVEAGVEPAQMIVKAMKARQYSTIVMGRRLDREKNIFRGVSDRVLANIDNSTLWVVG